MYARGSELILSLGLSKQWGPGPPTDQASVLKALNPNDKIRQTAEEGCGKRCMSGRKLEQENLTVALVGCT